MYSPYICFPFFKYLFLFFCWTAPVFSYWSVTTIYMLTPGLSCGSQILSRLPWAFWLRLLWQFRGSIAWPRCRAPKTGCKGGRRVWEGWIWRHGPAHQRRLFRGRDVKIPGEWNLQVYLTRWELWERRRGCGWDPDFWPRWWGREYRVLAGEGHQLGGTWTEAGEHSGYCLCSSCNTTRRCV